MFLKKSAPPYLYHCRLSHAIDYIRQYDSLNSVDSCALSNNYFVYSDYYTVFQYGSVLDLNIIFKNKLFTNEQLHEFVKRFYYCKNIIDATQKISLNPYNGWEYLSSDYVKQVINNPHISSETLITMFRMHFNDILKYRKLSDRHIRIMLSHTMRHNLDMDLLYKTQDLRTLFDSGFLPIQNFKLASKYQKLSYKAIEIASQYIKWDIFNADHLTNEQLLILKDKVNWDFINFNKRPVEMIEQLWSEKLLTATHIASMHDESFIQAMLSAEQMKSCIHVLVSQPRSEIFIRVVYALTNTNNSSFWSSISEMNISEQFIEEHIKKIYLSKLNYAHTYSDKFLETYQKKLNWKNIIKNRTTFTEEFVDKFSHRIPWDLFDQNNHVPEAVRYFATKYHTPEYLATPENPWFQKSLTDRCEQLSIFYNLSHNLDTLISYADVDKYDIDGDLPLYAYNMSHVHTNSVNKVAKILCAVDNCYLFPDGMIRVTKWDIFNIFFMKDLSLSC